MISKRLTLTKNSSLDFKAEYVTKKFNYKKVLPEFNSRSEYASAFFKIQHNKMAYSHMPNTISLLRKFFLTSRKVSQLESSI